MSTETSPATTARLKAFDEARKAEATFRSRVTDATFHTRWGVQFSDDDTMRALDMEKELAKATLAAAQEAYEAAAAYIVAVRNAVDSLDG